MKKLTDMSTDELAVHARFMAIEYLVGHLLAVNYRSRKATLEEIEPVHDGLYAALQKTTVPAAPAAISDFLVAEREVSVRRMLDWAETMLRQARK